MLKVLTTRPISAYCSSQYPTSDSVDAPDLSEAKSGVGDCGDRWCMVKVGLVK